MKMKKITFLFSMIAMLFVLTACSSGKEELDFSYSDADIIWATVLNIEDLQRITDAEIAYWEDSDDSMAEVYLVGVQNVENAQNECGDFKGYSSKNNNRLVLDFTELSQLEDEDLQIAVNNFVNSLNATVTEDGANVMVEITAQHQKRDVIYTFVYEKNPEADYSYEIYSQVALPYRVKEINATPNYTFGEKMAKAGSNTLMGMGTVFAVLIFISIIIAQFERISTLITKISERISNLVTKISNWYANRKKTDSETDKAYSDKKKAASAASVPVAASDNGNVDEGELIAVITAAVTAYSVACGGTDKLIVRSIKKAKR